MRPYYQDDFVTLYHGDSREVLPHLVESGFSASSVVTDPVWPDAKTEPPLVGADDPYRLLHQVAVHFPALAPRAVIHLGCDSDPRILSAIPPALPFLRLCWLEFAFPSYKGRLLNSSEVAYIFGEWPASKGRKVNMILPGKMMRTDSKKRPAGHPCPRAQSIVDWLVAWYGGNGPVLDPFAGIGTTLKACKDRGIPAVGVEIEERYCEQVAMTCRQEVLPLPPTTEGTTTSPDEG